MTDRSEPVAPSPLHAEPELGALMRQANEQYAAGLDEAAAYRRIEEQLAPVSARGRGSFGARHAGAFLGALALAGGLVWLKASGDMGPSIVLGPEERKLEGPATARWAEEAAFAEPSSLGDRELAAPGQVLRPRDAPSLRELPPELPSEARAEPQRKRMRTLPEEQPRKESPKEPPPKEQAHDGSATQAEAAAPAEALAEPKVVARAAELDCMQMARDGAPRQAETCFVTLASGAGLRAEMALHEMARLRRDVLGDASGALAALSEYRQRFPRGSLRHEVALSRVELLVRLGRTRDALRESEELLTSRDGRVRAAELHVLRGNMYRSALSDLNAAAAEFARAERLGGALGAEATYLRGTCLEALGDGRAALEAYERYMSAPRRPRAAEVRRRIAALSVPAQAVEQKP